MGKTLKSFILYKDISSVFFFVFNSFILTAPFPPISPPNTKSPSYSIHTLTLVFKNCNISKNIKIFYLIFHGAAVNWSQTKNM